ncbi:MAG TPA: ATP-binding protein [Bryobacteraceae bacterium]|nr:ATP-binding protein [Bryobacteraceae bacterium]
MNWPRRGAIGAGTITAGLGLAVLAAWAAHWTFLIQIAPRLAPMQRNTAAGLILSGLAMVALAGNRRKPVLLCCGLLSMLAVISLIECVLTVDLGIDQLLGPAYIDTLVSARGRMSPLTAAAFLVLAVACAVSQKKLRARAAILGISGAVIGAIGTTCCITALAGVGDAFTWGKVTQMAVHTAACLVIVGAGLTALAWDLRDAGPSEDVSEPLWVSFGSGLFLLIVRLGLWQAWTARQHGWYDFFSTLTLVLTVVSAIWVAAFVHLLLKARLQGESLRLINRKLHREIADRRQAERIAQEASRAKSDFLANMSHEIRTPMTGVLGMIDLVRSTGLSIEQKEHLDLARSSADSLLSLLNEILDLSKIESGRLELSLAPFSLRRCIEDAGRMFELKAREKGLELRTEIDSRVPDWLVGDALRLRQVLVNLLGNAVKFTDSGSVSLRVTLETETSSGSDLLIEVRDTGIGISPEKHRLIFDAFRQSDGSTTRKYGGTGLGLTISARLVELMGGNISLASEPGKGSTFACRLRFERASAPDMPVAEGLFRHAIAAAPEKRRLRILLAEDNVVNQKLVAELLRREGQDIEVAGNGREAVAAAERAAFDLIFMDVQMPEMDGFEATGEIRRMESNSGQHTPIIAVTANAMKGDEQRCIQAGMDDYISKPINVQDLRAILKKWPAGAQVSQPL